MTQMDDMNSHAMKPNIKEVKAKYVCNAHQIYQIVSHAMMLHLVLNAKFFLRDIMSVIMEFLSRVWTTVMIFEVVLYVLNQAMVTF